MDFWTSIRKGPVSLGFEGMPLLMRVGIIGSTLFVGVWLLFVPFAALNLGTYTINDREVTGRYFLLHAYPFLLPFCGLMAAIAYGYWTERLWAPSGGLVLVRGRSPLALLGRRGVSE
jgi:hypothetical protein